MQRARRCGRGLRSIRRRPGADPEQARAAARPSGPADAGRGRTFPRRRPPAPASPGADRGGIADGIEPVDAAKRCRRNHTTCSSRASASERALILHNLEETPLRASRADSRRARHARDRDLEMAAFAADVENFTLELGETLILPSRIAAQVVNDPGGEPLACAAQGAGHAEPGVSAGVAVPQSGIRLLGAHMSTGCRGSMTG